MEDLLPILFFIIVLVVRVATRSAKTKRSGSGQRRNTSNRPVFQKLIDDLALFADQQHKEWMAPVKPRQDQRTLEAEPEAFAVDEDHAERIEGDGYADDSGCVGGSIVHERHEGQEFPGHEHASPARPRTAPVSTPARGVRSLSAARMRSAVVLSEVLGPPVSTRRR